MTSRIALSLILCGSLLAAVTPPANGARSVQYGDKDVVRINARLRFTTLIVLPKNEQILDFVCGDKEFWIVNGNQNFAYVKPAKERARTDLNLITASGNVYSFVLEEGSSQPEAEPDLKVFVELRDEAMVSAIAAPPRFVTAQAVEDYRQQMEMAKAETRAAKETAQKTVEREAAKFREDYPTNALKFPYRFQANAAPFRVTAIYHDDKFTYIKTNAPEKFSVYEMRDGKPNLINYDLREGTYIIPKVMDNGYVELGKKKMEFTRKG